MGFKFSLTSRAEHNILDSIDWYNEKQYSLGDKFYKDSTIALNYVVANPYLFSVKRSPFRECALKKFPYLIVYTIQNDTVIIASVFNTSKNPGQKPKKY
jgi:hypothetical protein